MDACGKNIDVQISYTGTPSHNKLSLTLFLSFLFTHPFIARERDIYSYRVS
eukprot:COSAG02_NODE_5687_length_4126_cov_2.973429_4_plen_51_part_00